MKHSSQPGPMASIRQPSASSGLMPRPLRVMFRLPDTHPDQQVINGMGRHLGLIYLDAPS